MVDANKTAPATDSPAAGGSKRSRDPQAEPGGLFIPKINPEPSAGEPSPSAQAAIAQAQAKVSGQATGPTVIKTATPRSTPSSSPPSIKASRHFPRFAKIVLVIIGIFVLLGVAIAIPAFKTLQTAKNTLATAREAYAAGKNQNLPEFNQKLAATHDQLLQTHKTYRLLIWTKVIPVLNWYWNDGDHAFKALIAGTEAAQILGTTLEPYADVLGFQGQGSFT
ncbi:MAG: hypothetical protein HYS86_00505, partial [Candidatus Chisholmbacteria bacterium]|nr:hypothetical protein [Candidatus Chisholmbacteria bacterium]